jgi:hypothetical protein
MSYCEYGNEPLEIIKRWEFLDQLSNCLLRKKHGAAWSYIGSC